MNEVKTREQIANEAIEWSASQGAGGDLRDVIVSQYLAIKAREEQIEMLTADLEEEHAERMKVTAELQERTRNEGGDQKAHPDVVEALKRSLAKEKELSETLQIRAVSLDDLSKGLQKENEKLAHEAKDLKEDLETARDRIEELEKELCMAEGDRDELQEKVDKLTDRAERAEKEIRELKMIGAIEHDDWKTLSREDQTIVTINRKPDEILSVSVLFTNEREEEEDDGEN